MAQSLVPIFGELLASDVVEEEFELQKETLSRNMAEMTQRYCVVSFQPPCCSSLFSLPPSAVEATAGVHTGRNPLGADRAVLFLL